MFPFHQFFPLLACIADEEGRGHNADPQSDGHMDFNQFSDFRYNFLLFNIHLCSKNACIPSISSSINFYCLLILLINDKNVGYFPFLIHNSLSLCPSVFSLSLPNLFLLIALSLSAFATLSPSLLLLCRAASITYYNLLRRARRERVKVKCLLGEVVSFEIFRLPLYIDFIYVTLLAYTL